MLIDCKQWTFTRPMRISLSVMMCLLMMGALPGCQTASSNQTTTQRLRIGSLTFDLELALDPESRYQGLSDRAHIPEHGGMLFVFPQPRRACFVMRRCLVPIDLAFVDRNGRIIALHEMRVEPYDTPESELTPYCSQWPAQAAVEFAGGTIQRLALQVGQQLDLPLDQLRQRAR